MVNDPTPGSQCGEAEVRLKAPPGKHTLPSSAAGFSFLLASRRPLASVPCLWASPRAALEVAAAGSVGQRKQSGKERQAEAGVFTT